MTFPVLGAESGEISFNTLETKKQPFLLKT